MLTIICGEDVVGSRNYFFSLKEQYKNKNYQIINIEPNRIEEIIKWQSQAQHLFKPKIVFFTENLFKKYLNKKKAVKEEIIKKINSLKEDLFDWEEAITQYELNTKNVLIKEFKPPTSIFKLLDNLYPGNLNNFYKIYSQFVDKHNEQFIFYMICKHIRKLILIKENQLESQKNNWQEKKLYFQSKFWNKEKLFDFYEGLFRIDLLIKTSATPFSLKNSLEILFCYFL